jgi:HEAT repeat protein
MLWRMRTRRIIAIFFLAGLVLAVLINSIQFSSATDVRWSATEALEKFGTNALSAAPILLKALQDADTTVRDRAKTSLKQIDPDAALTTMDK